jgi:hypothetical protein
MKESTSITHPSWITQHITNRRRLNGWGNQRMAHVYPLLKAHFSVFQPAGNLREEFLYNLIEAGKHVRMQPFKLGSP